MTKYLDSNKPRFPKIWNDGGTIQDLPKGKKLKCQHPINGVELSCQQFQLFSVVYNIKWTNGRKTTINHDKRVGQKDHQLLGHFGIAEKPLHNISQKVIGLQKVGLLLNLVSIYLTGSAIAKSIVAPLFVSITAMSAILIQAYLARTKINSYIKNNTLASAVLNQLKGYMRSLVFNEKIYYCQA